MSEKRFTIHKESKYKEEWYAYPFCIKEDGEVVFNTIPLSIAEKVRDKLNELQATIDKLDQENADLLGARIKAQEEWEKCTDKLKAKILEQQATIDELEKNFDDLVKWASEIAKRNVVLDEQIGQLQRENEQLRNIIKQKEKEEKLYAKEILRLNELNKQTSEFTDILGGY